MGNNDQALMAYCLELAKKGYGWTSPNPVVGAAVVRDNTVLSSGWHRRFGGPHAEVEALCGMDAAGATLYVTLEPCCFHGKTPPCTDLIIRSGIKRVVVGTLDPNPRVAGKGVQQLRRAGIRVRTGVLGKACRQLNRFFNKHITTGLPYVILKAGMTLDGKISPQPGKQAKITGAASRRHANRFRSVVDAILVGAGTAAVDNPRLTARAGDHPHQPVRVVLDTHGTLPPSLDLFTDKKAPTLWVTGPDAALRAVSVRNRQKKKEHQVERVEMPLKNGRIDLKKLLRFLGERGIMGLLVEGGSAVNASFFAAGLVDEVQLYVAPQVMGAGAVPWLGDGFPAKGPRLRMKFNNWEIETLKDGFVFTGRRTIRRKKGK